ncbi:unnamed protein product [Kuraishia capsulata CBS 1993]|uniref:Dienelactone hydrolase domain-containing protein n=1 Tax=Kuraishia capsulata CBS 1993 TaxID=1382522 RepID=W6MT07_9ASCO|nr:uncharacterized protein KUCA_T00000882001 [Kuraishia capsulata CBS 1993]CDK24915.1 unnamed protein product [Kuraishia capsulata CBS 1993]
MASNLPSQCCVNFTFHAGEPKGSIEEIYGNKVTYVSGDVSNKIVIIFTDIYGVRFKNVQLIADRFAAEGYYALIPDLFQGEIFTAGSPIEELYAFVGKHAPNATTIASDFISKLKADIPEAKIHGIGHCFGAKVVIPGLSESGLVDVGAVAHPSLVTIEEVSQIKKPLLISAAELDPAFTVELRHLTEAKLIEIGAEYQITLFAGVEHGFAVKGDMEVPKIRKAAEKVILDQLYFFDNY